MSSPRDAPRGPWSPEDYRGARYFPELEAGFRSNLPARCVVDGEIVIATERGLDFDALQMRLHPAASRVKKLAAETPASFVAFDLLAGDAGDVRSRPQAERRLLLEEALERASGGAGRDRPPARSACRVPRAAGARARISPGSRCVSSACARSSTTTARAIASDTPPRSCAGVPTSGRRTAVTTSSTSRPPPSSPRFSDSFPRRASVRVVVGIERLLA